MPIKVLITVTDVNDKRPVFEEKIADNDCNFITEFHDLNEPVLTVRASDGDDPQTPNGQLTFEIIAGERNWSLTLTFRFDLNLTLKAMKINCFGWNLLAKRLPRSIPKSH